MAQLVARSVRDAEAVGSSPITLTIFLWLQKKQIELGTGASQGADGSAIFYRKISKYAENCCSLLDTKMSGSPIIQEGKIIGAVTHVLVNHPEKGYGIFIENMLEH